MKTLLPPLSRALSRRPLALGAMTMLLFATFASQRAAGQAGSVDLGYDPNVSGSSVLATAVQPDGKTLIGGYFVTVGGAAHANLARLNVDGSVDASFTANANNGVLCAAVQADGKIVLGGSFTAVNSEARNRIARLNADGSLDATFNAAAGVGGSPPYIYSVVVQVDGKILLGGAFNTVNGTAHSGIARLNGDGSLDASFSASTNGFVTSVAAQADGKILLGGEFNMVNGTARTRIARLNADGSVDAAFDPGSGANNTVDCVAVQADGKILLGGAFSVVNGTARSRIARLNADGSLESTATFDPGTGAISTVYGLAVQADGKILLGGQFTSVNGTAHFFFARLHADGSVDLAFNPASGAVSTVSGLAVQADGKILLGGQFTSVNGTARNRIARLNNDAAAHSLSAPDATRVQWLRSGAGPEVSPVSFDLSTDGGASWTPLGAGARIAGGWQLTGLSLPGAGGLLRARARTAGGQYSGSSGLVEQVAALAFAPTVTAPSSTSITATSATLGGTATSDGGAAIIERGVFYSITAVNGNPVIDGTGVTKVTSSGTTDVFIVNLTGLNPGTGYSFKAYAINNAGTTYTSPVSTFTTLTALQFWRLTYFGTTANAGNAADTADPDGDGANNLFEYVAGLVPTNPASRFACRIEAVPGLPSRKSILFSPIVAGRTYLVKSKANLTDATWAPLGSSSTSDNGAERTVTDLGAGSGPRFYHVEITLP